jgi:mRNA degradation ribonuclease J1/J2
LPPHRKTARSFYGGGKTGETDNFSSFHYIHFSTGFSDYYDQAADLDRLRNWVRWIGLELIGDPDDANSPALHASGHACGDELAEFVRTVKPKILIPIHTEHPEWWEETLGGSGIEVRKPEVGSGIRI